MANIMIVDDAAFMRASIRNMLESNGFEVAGEAENGADAVRIMTVHGSKGLQAPIVILPDMVRQVNSKKGMGMLWDDVFYYPLSSADYEKNCEIYRSMLC